LSDRITVAVVGNPNSGKTTLFNKLTGARQHVGNWPGVTVEKKEGKRSFQGHELHIVDLPGVYSLSAYSLDEIIARNFVVDEEPDVVVDIVDAANLERNLYLTVQLLEMEARVIVALNMMDMAKSRRYVVNVDELSRLIGVPVVPTVATRDQGVEELLHTIVNVMEDRAQTSGLRLHYGREVEREIDRLEKVITQSEITLNYPPRWLAIKLLEEDEQVVEKLKG
jgi:ferrous iron transport protein B